MSSILDALKKAEQESTPDRGMDTPWPPLPAEPDRQGFRWWWVPLGLVVLLGISGLVVWQVSGPEATRPEKSDTRLTSLEKEPEGTASRVATEPPLSVPAVPSKQSRPAVPSAEASRKATPQQAAEPSAGSRAEGITPPPEKLPAQAVEQQVLPSDVSPPEPVVPPSSVPPVASRQRQTVSPMPVPVEVPVAPPSSRPTATATETGQAAEAAPDIEKTYRSDPRIDLQALVWAPDAAARFVVINNRLIKEGGTVGSIAVEKINPDDVLLTEGADRWYVKFSIR